MSRVWDETPFDQTTLLVLLCLADHADDDGRCWPSVPRLATRARCSERWCRDVLASLEESGWLERELRPGKSTMYRIIFPAQTAPTPEPQITPEVSSPLNPGSGVPRNPRSGDPGTGAPMNHQEPSSESSVVVGGLPEAPHQSEALRTPSRRGWQPSEAALATAENTVTLVDIPLHIARYWIVKTEKRQQPSSSEWLRWLLADEAKAKQEERKEARESRQDIRWDKVAD